MLRGGERPPVGGDLDFGLHLRRGGIDKKQNPLH
jgi:hypothetical protein